MPRAKDEEEQQQRIAELQKSQRYWKSIAENSPDHVMVLDMEYKIQFINHTVPDLTKEEVIGRSNLNFVPAESHLLVTECLERVIRSGKPDKYEIKYITSDGETQFFDVRVSPLKDEDGNTSALICTSNNITERKKMEEALRDSEKRYRSLSEAAFEAIFISEKGICLEQNHTAEIMFGYTLSEAVGRSGTEWIVPEDREKVMKNMLSGYEEAYEVTALRKDGSTFPSEIQAKMMQYKGRTVRITALNDITKRKQAEEELRESEEKCRSILETAANLITSVNSDGIIIDCNNQISSLLGYTKEEIIGSSMGRIIHPDYMEKAAESLNEILRTGFSYDREYKMIRKNGEVIDVSINSSGLNRKNGEYERTICIISDITKRKQAENALRESENKYRMIAERISDVIFIADLNAVIEYTSPSVERVFGYSPSELTGRKILEFVPEDEWPSVIKTFQASARGESIEGVQSEFIKKDGSVATVEVNALPVYIDDKIVGAQAIAHDITERREAEDKLLQAQKMESIGRLAGGVAHDFNNMLSVILGHTEMALDEIEPDGLLRDHLMEIRAATERSADLTSQLLAFARKQTISPTILDPNETIEGMLKMLRRLIGEHIELSWLPGVDIWPICADPSQIDQILANLCVNAQDAIQGVGNVSISTANIAFDEAFCAANPGSICGEYVMLSVSDTGCGIDAETMNNLFEPFFTTKGIGKGTGLGLATVYGIIKQNNGFIKVSSVPGRGTTIKVYLPRHEGGNEHIHKNSQISPSRIEHGTIMLVEDEPAILRLATMMLQRMGYTVMAASTPIDAISLTEGFQGEINLLMTDVVMPEMNGRDLAESLISIYPDLKCLFMSGYTADVIAHQGVLDDGVHFIQKPFTNQDLAASIQEALGFE